MDRLTPVGERRAWPRVPCVRGRRLRIRPGHDVRLVNISSGGALFEAKARLMPKALVELRCPGEQGAVLVRGRVVRSFVSCVDPNGLCYRAAVEFDRAIDVDRAQSAARWDG